MKCQKATQDSSLKRKLNFRKKAIIVAFTLYVTFILLSRIPYIAEPQVRSRADMDDEYVYNLVFPEDGTHTHYYVERWDTSAAGRIELTYWTATHTLNVETTNLKVLTIDCKLIYFGESMKVFKMNPHDDPAYYKQYFIDNDEFLINIEANDKINELKFLEFPEPTEVWVNDEKLEEDTDYKFVGNGMEFEEVPQGTTKVVLFFLEKFPPVAKFTMTKSSTQMDKKNVYELNQEISFDGTTSTDKDGTIEEYEWDFGDGSLGMDVIITHKYTELGEFNVTLEVTDDHGLTGTVEKALIIVRSTDDLDGDAMPDWWEYNYMPKVNPETPDADEDADDDGLTNLQEYLNNTDPRKIDSDGDEYSDYDEIVKHKTNASNPNSMPEEKKGTGLDELLNYLIIIAIVIIILIFIVLGLLIRKRKKKVEEKERAAPEVEEGAEGEAGPVPGMPPMQFPMPGPGAGAEEAMYGEQYPGITPYPPEPEPMRAPGERKAPPITREEIYKPGAVPEPPLLKAEPKYPYSGIEEDVAHEELASAFEGMAIPPEEGIPGLEEGLPPEEELHEEEVPAEEMPEEEMPEEEVPKEEPEEKVEFTVKDYVKLGAIHFKNEEYSDAIIEWQKALDIEPDHPEIVTSIKEAMAKLREKK